jgi:hypothetical protein
MVQALNKSQAEWQAEFDRMALYSRSWAKLEDDKLAFSNGPSSYRDDALSLLVGNRIFDNARVLFESQMETVRAALESEASAIVSLMRTDYIIVALKEFLDTGETEVGEGFEEIDINSNINPAFDGILGELRSQMNNAMTTPSNETYDWEISGRVFGVNCGTYGDLWSKWFDAGGGDYTVELYKDAGLTQLVATGTRTGSPGVVTLSQVALSGIDATCYLDYGADLDSIVTTQRIKRAIIGYDPITAYGDNAGSIIRQNDDAYASVINGDTIEIICIDGTLGFESFRVTSKELGDADFNTFMHRLFTSIRLGVSFYIKRDYLTGGFVASFFSSWNLSGENDSNCPGGVYHGETVADGLNTIVNLYSDVARSNLVATGTVVTATGGTCNFSTANGGPTGSVVVGAGVTPGLFDVNLQSPEVGDRWSFDMTNDEAGLFDMFFTRNFNVVLPSAPSGSETINDVP